MELVTGLAEDWIPVCNDDEEVCSTPEAVFPTTLELSTFCIFCKFLKFAEIKFQLVILCIFPHLQIYSLDLKSY
jgi:hypothetical protein